ncbi:MAG TPA: PEGA domain-containing protein [Candidatus Xenobia bacterium]|jgi:hypothetical protein
MNAFRLVILVLVTYVLGLGTGAVGGVFLSYKELTKPVAMATSVVTATATVTVTPTEVAVASSESPSGSPSIMESATASPTVEKTVEPAASSSPTEEAASAAPSETSTPATSSSGADGLATLDVVANKGEGYTTYVDGLSAGDTPVTVQVVPGQTHKIKVVGGDKFSTWEGTVKLSAGEKRTVTAELKAKASPTPEHHAQSGGGYVPPAYHGGGHSGGGAPSLNNGTRRF